MGNRWRKKKIEVKVIFKNFVPFSRPINFVRQRRKTEKKKKKKNLVSGTQIIVPIKQTQQILGPVESIFSRIF